MGHPDPSPPTPSTWFSATQHTAKVVKHARRGAPDITPLERNRQIMAVPAAEAELAALVVGGIQEMLERSLEYFGHLERIGLQLDRRFDPAHHRRDAKAGRNLVIRKPAQQLHFSTRKADFLFGFSQRRLFPARVVRLHAASRKTNLAGVIVEVRRALRE